MWLGLRFLFPFVLFHVILLLSLHVFLFTCFGVVVKWKVRTPGAPLPGKFLGHGKCDDYSKSIAFGKPVNTVPVIAAALIRVIGQFLDKHKVPATELRGFAVSMTRITLEKDIGSGDRTTADSTKEQSYIQAFAKLTTASQIRASVHPRALPTGDEDPKSLVDLTDIPTQADALKNAAKKVQKRITRQLRASALPEANESAVVVPDEGDEEYEMPNKRQREDEEEEDEDEDEDDDEMEEKPITFTPKQDTIDFNLLVRWLEEEAKAKAKLSALDERLLQCRLTSILREPGLDLEAATRLLRTLRLFCQSRDVDTSWTDVLKHLTERANELVADTLGLPCGTVLVL